jgi:predicted  nucleic acid-binding Zn-ribbon protein
MDFEDRMTAQELKAMRGSSWAAIILAILGFAAAAGFGGLYILNYSEAKLAREKVVDVQANNDEKTSELKETVTRLEGELEDRRDKIDELTAKLNKEQLLKQEEKNRADSLAKMVDEQDGRIKRLESGNQEILKLRGEMAGKEGQVRALENQLQNTRNNLSNTQTNLSNSKSENEKLEKEISRLRRELDSVREQATSASVDKATASVLQTQIKDKERQIEDLKEKLKKSKNALQQKEKEVGTLRETLGKAGNEAAELQKCKDELSKRDREIGRKDSEIQSLASKVKKLEEQTNDDRRQIDSLRNTLAQRGDVSEQVKSLSEALAGRDQTIKEKNKEIVVLKDQIAKSKDSAKQSTEATGTKVSELEKQLTTKSTEVVNLQKGLENLKEENENLYSRLKSEERAIKMVEKGEELEQVRFLSSIWRTSNTMTVKNSGLDSGSILLPGHKIDLDNDLGLEMGKSALMIEVVASGRFGFMLNYQEFTFSGRSVMPVDKNFFGSVFEAGNTVDSEFYLQQVGLGLMANMGALHKSDTRRIDLGLLLGGRYLKFKGYMLDRTDGDRASDSLDAPVLFPGVRVSAKYRDGIYWAVQLAALSYKYGDFDMRNLLEAKVSFGFNIMDSLDIEFGYLYSNTNYKWEDGDTREEFITNFTAEGPYLSVIFTF